MQPIDKTERQVLVEQAAKAFPNRSPSTLEQEFDEMESLLAASFTHEDGRLPQEQKTRLETLFAQFYPKRDGQPGIPAPPGCNPP